MLIYGGLSKAYDSTSDSLKGLLVDSTGTAISGSNPLPTTATIVTGDIEIGAVELKDATTDARAPISATDGVLVNLGTNNDITGTITANAGTNLNTSSLATQTTVADIKTELQTLNSLIPSVYDYISLSYTGSNLTTVLFKIGGSGGTTISTLTLVYDGNNNLTSVTKS